MTGSMLMGIGFTCMAAGVVMFVIYLIAGKAAGRRLKKKLMEEY